MPNLKQASQIFHLADAQSLLSHDPDRLTAMMKTLHIAEIASLILETRDQHECQRLLRYVPNEVLGEVLLTLPEGIREDLLALLPSAVLSLALHDLSSDDAADLLQGLTEEKAETLLASLSEEDRREVRRLLSHDEESAGGLMQAELFKVRVDWSVGKVLKVLRRWGREIENLNYIYIVDDDDRLVGSLALHRLLFCEKKQAIAEVMHTRPAHALAGQDQEEVARIFEHYDVLALPVIDNEGVLIGRITADDILDVVQEEATEDMYRLAAVSDDDDLSEPIGITAWRRGIWLGLNLLTALLASFVISQFEGVLSSIVALAILMPVVASMGGIAGTQTLTVMVRSIALGRVSLAVGRRAVLKETFVGLINGCVFALILGAIASVWFPVIGWHLGLVIAASMLVNLTAAGMAGAMIPLTLKRFHIDPALASGTMLTTVTDVVGFLSFLGLAQVFLLPLLNKAG